MIEPCLGATAIIEERSWSDAKLLGDVVEEFLRNVLARPQAETRMPEQAQLDGKPEAVHRATVLSDRQLDVVCRKRVVPDQAGLRSEEHTSELQSLMRISYAVFCVK